MIMMDQGFAVVTESVRPPCVAVGDDGSWHSRAAVTRAADEAVRRHLPLLVIGLHLPVVDPNRSVTAQLRDEREAAEATEAALEATVTRIHAAGPHLEVNAALLVDPTVDELAERLAGCVLLVVGAGSARRPSVFRFDSASQRLLHAVDCPVLVVPDEHRANTTDTAGEVVVGVDGRPLSQLVLKVAAEEAVLLGGRLSVVHAYGTPAQTEPEASRMAAERLWDKVVAAADLPDRLSVTRHVVPAEPFTALCDYGRDGQLLVIGARGALALGHLTQGSLSRAVLDELPCPVLLVRPPSRAASGPSVEATASTMR